MWNIANVLTMLRIALVPLFVLAFVHDGGRDTGWRLVAAGAVFFVASATDRLDGQLARKHDLVTDFGKIADPIADKALIGAALICLSLQHRAVVVGDRGVILVGEIRGHRADAGLGDQVRGDRGQPGRQGQDRPAVPGDLPVRGPRAARRCSATW